MSCAFFIVDCDADSGLGHFMRSLALAESLQARGVDVVWCSSTDVPGWMADRVTVGNIDQLDDPIVVIDTYREHRVPLLLGHRNTISITDDTTPRFSADFYVVPGFVYSDRLASVSREATIMQGLDYILIRREMQRDYRSSAFGRPLTIGGVLVALGSSQAWSSAAEISDIINKTVANVKVDILSAQTTNESLNADAPASQRLPINPSPRDMYRAFDVAITTASVTAWELLHLGVPIGVIAATSNQESNYRFMTEHGLAVGLGRTYVGDDIDSRSLRHLLLNSQLRATLAQAGWNAVDGLGSDRVAEHILRARDSGGDD